MINAVVHHGCGHYIAKIEGHAGFAPKGQDIVCAGVSALAMALHSTVAEYIVRSDAQYYMLEIDDGCFEIKVQNVYDKEKAAVLDGFFSMLIAGLEMIEKEYPDYLQVKSFIFTKQDEYDDTSEQTMDIE